MVTGHTRIFLGYVAGALSTLTFHQMTVQLFFWLGLAPHSAFQIAQLPPFGAPIIVSASFWGGIYGGVFGFLSARPYHTVRMRGPYWANGLLLGFVATLVFWFVTLPFRGQPVAFGWQTWPMLRSLIIDGAWGVGVGLILPWLHPRSLRPTRTQWVRDGVAT